jgi:hypothetical protein
MTYEAPTLVELRDYALGRGSKDAADRVRRYLLTSGDERALAYVEAVSAAQRRVEVHLARSFGTWRARIASMLERFGRQVSELHVPDLGVPDSSAATLSADHRNVAVDLSSTAPRFLYLLAAGPTGVLRLLDPTSLAGDVRRAKVAVVEVPDDATAVIGISASEALLSQGFVLESADLTAVLPSLRGVGDAVGLTVREVDGDVDE